MASRHVTAGRRRALVAAIRHQIQAGRLRPGDLVPPLRQLADEHHLAHTTVALELRRLVAEGLLRSVPSVGYVVDQPVTTGDACYLVITPPRGGPNWRLEGTPAAGTVHGFERRVTSYGGHSLRLRADEALSDAAAGRLPPLAGAFSFSCGVEVSRECCAALDVPFVRYGVDAPLEMVGDRPVDTVDHDNVGGGGEATRQLLRRGHRRIAFLGVHFGQGQPRRAVWSRRREEGWRQAMERAVADGVPLLALHPDTEPARPPDRRGGAPDITPISDPFARYGGGQALVAVGRIACAHRDEFSAVVGADDMAVLHFVHALQEAGVPPEDWPEMVGFEDLPEAAPYNLTSVRPGWHRMGRTAADLLWQRHTGRLTGGAEHRVIPMSVIARTPRFPTAVEGGLATALHSDLPDPATPPGPG